MPRVALRDGGSIWYQSTSLVDPWRTPETVFLHHGLGKSSRWWRPWVRLLAGEYRVIAVDMLGNGRSSHPRGRTWGIEGYAANVVEVLDALDIDRVHFMGETVGGCVGLVMGARYGDRIRSLALASCPVKPPRERLMENSREIARVGLQPSVDRELPGRLDWSRYPPAMYDWYRTERLSSSPRIVAEQTAAQGKEDLTWTLRRITAPTLLFVPDESPVGANDQMLQIAESVPGARLADLGTGRKPVWYHYGEADACVAEYRRFLDDLPPAS